MRTSSASSAGPYNYFFALPPERWNNSLNFCYLFIWDSEGHLACQTDINHANCIQSKDLLSILPYLEPNNLDDRELRANFQLFGFISNTGPIRGSEILQQPQQQSKALCFVSSKEDCCPKYLFKLGVRSWQSFNHLLLHCAEWQIGLLARAKELAYFSCGLRFCSSCGAGLQWLNNEFGKSCMFCQALFFPRQDPSVISLVCEKATDGSGREWLLLAHNIRFRAHVYSLIAGFVDAGETLEQAIVRECWEEAGVYLEDLQYLYSQAWPQPHSLMAGFQAYSRGGMAQCRPDAKEIVTLLWLERSDIRRCLEQQSRTKNFIMPLTDCTENYVLKGEFEETSFCLPRVGSIARKMIEQWVGLEIVI